MKTSNANYLHKFPTHTYQVAGIAKPYEPKPHKWTAEEIADMRAFLRSGLTEDEWNARKH